MGYKESGCDTLALGSLTCSLYSNDTRENYLGFIVGWETLKAFLKCPVPRPGIEPGTSTMVDRSVTTRLPHHLT
ncbi:hypothetical protein DPMN_172177 [Dreissena polymorpha]|uniref:Uncharacterized protein n=1 Tax=Dreissena polymorpha TaxID=45954 RepID=A0A9D4E2M1_DREPO|nr:hypothetical protein DPMN_172177 [Dreissena polymorpha]